jgi:glycine hydroxymethyltransferase
MIVAGASSYSRFIDYNRFCEIAKAVGAFFVVDMAHVAGLIAARVHPSPVSMADAVTSTTHKTMRGPRGGFILAKKLYGGAIDQHIFPGTQGGPLMHTIAAKAVAFNLAASEGFCAYQQQVVINAKALADRLMERGLHVVTGGTDNHMFVLDLRNLNLTGQKAERILEQAGITVNKNVVPFDPQPPKITSGIRIGTPAVTTRGMIEHDMVKVADRIADVLMSPDNIQMIHFTKNLVSELCSKYPLIAR